MGRWAVGGCNRRYGYKVGNGTGSEESSFHVGLMGEGCLKADAVIRTISLTDTILQAFNLR